MKVTSVNEVFDPECSQRDSEIPSLSGVIVLGPHSPRRLSMKVYSVGEHEHNDWTDGTTGAVVSRAAIVGEGVGADVVTAAQNAALAVSKSI